MIIWQCLYCRASILPAGMKRVEGKNTRSNVDDAIIKSFIDCQTVRFVRMHGIEFSHVVSDSMSM